MKITHQGDICHKMGWADFTLVPFLDLDSIVVFRVRRDPMKGFHPQNENYPQILGINADFFLCVLCVSAVYYLRGRAL